MTRAVLDPNVYVAAIIQPAGVPAGCLRAYGEGRFELVVSPLLLAELRDVLRREKFRAYLTVEQADAIVDAIARDAQMVEDPPRAGRVSRDPGDDYLVALGLVAAAHVLVTGDADLLGVATAGLRIATPREFLERLPG